MEKFLIATGKTIDLAIQAALDQLSMDRDSVSVEVLENAKSGFLGIGAQPAKVKVSYEVPDEEPKPVQRVALQAQERSCARRAERRRPARDRARRPEAGAAACHRPGRPEAGAARHRPGRPAAAAPGAQAPAGSRPAPRAEKRPPEAGSPRPRT